MSVYVKQLSDDILEIGIDNHPIADVKLSTATVNLRGTLQINGTTITATGAELNTMSGVTASAAEINLIDGSTAGTNVAGKALVTGGTYKQVDEIHAVKLFLGSNAGTEMTKTAAQLNAAVVGVAGGYKIARGTHSTVAAVDTVVSGLTTVVAVLAVLDAGPVAGCHMATAMIGDQEGAPAAGSFYLKTWKPTATDDTALVAASTFSQAVNWIAIGT